MLSGANGIQAPSVVRITLDGSVCPKVKDGNLYIYNSDENSWKDVPPARTLNEAGLLATPPEP